MGPEAAAVSSETRSLIESSLAGMPDEERTVIVLAYRDGLSQSEIAERLDWPLGTVKTRTRRALHHLRDTLETHGTWGTRIGADGGAGRPWDGGTGPPGWIGRGWITTRYGRHWSWRRVEPGGLERLMAGDTPAAQAVAGHLAGCEACALELERVGRVERGRPRVDGRGALAGPQGADAGLRAGARRAARGRGGSRTCPWRPRRRSPRRPITTIGPSAATAAASSGGARPSILAWVGAIAAAIVLSVAATTLIVGSRVDDRLAAQDQAIEDLAAVTTATLQVASEPDAERVALESPTGTATTGTLLYSPSTTDTVVVATGLSEPTDGAEYHCWVEVDGARRARRQDVLRRRDRLLGRPGAGRLRAERHRDVRRVARGHGRRARSPPTRSSSGPPRRRSPGAASIGLGVVGHRDGVVGRRRVEIDPVELEQPLRGVRADVPALACSTADSQSASRGRSTASMSTSRRRESATTNQTSPAPTTSPTMSSHQLNSAFTAGV